MTRGRKPQVRWWDRNGGGYFCTLRGQKVPLAMGPDDAPEGPNYLAALAEFAKVLAGETGKGTPRLTVAGLLNAYRQYVADDGRHETLASINTCLKPFSEEHGHRGVGELGPGHVREWLKDRKSWGESTKALAVKLLMAALNWGVTEGLVPANPLRGRIARRDRPREIARGKEARLSPALADLITANACPALRLLCRVWRGTGARPEEVEQCEAWNYQNGRIVYRWQATEGFRWKGARRGQKKDRTIFLTPELQGLIEAQIARHPSGKIFRTPTGMPWTVRHRGGHWRRMRSSAPVAAHLEEHGIDPESVVPYSFRHSWASEFLESGLSIKICADLMGTSVAILEKHSAHPDADRLADIYRGFMTAGE